MLQKQEKTGCPPLTDIALEALASNIRQVPSLVGWTGQVLPEELSCSLLEVVIQKGKLNVKVLEMFEQTEHESLLASTAGLDKWSLPLLTCDQNGPLGYTKPTWQ